MTQLFISHSSANNAAAIALCEWLSEQGFDDVFLDVDPERGLVAGQRWQDALKAAADRCEAVLFLVSPAWLASKWCLAEFLLAKTLHKRIFGLIVESVSLERVPVEMTGEWQMCELVGGDPLRTFDVSIGAKRETIAFREAGLDLLRRGLERAGLDATSFPWPPPTDLTRSPYRGLCALEAQDAAIFFGRDAAIVRGLDRIRGLNEGGVEKLFVILGASGSGKSSFLRAGLWPRLARDDLAFLTLPVIRPQTAVISGSSGLAAALANAFERLGAARPPGRIKEALTDGADQFGRLLDQLSDLAKRRLVGLQSERQAIAIVLAIDQAEELFNTDGSSEASTFLQLLAGVLTPIEGSPARRVLAIATMRSDRYEFLQAEPHLLTVKQDLFNLAPIPPAEFKTVIEGPARRVVEAGGRLTIDPALTERLIADAQGADALPLLAFTLERLYADYGSDGKLTLGEYEKLGGVQGSIAAAVAGALAEPGRAPSIPTDPAVQLAAVRAAFIPWLARINRENTTPTRRVARRSEIPEASRAVVDRLVEARLLVADRRGGADVIEVAHESLLRQWPALTAWLAAEAIDLQLVEGIEHAAGEWDRNGRRDSWLDHRDDRLVAAERLTARDAFRQRLGENGAAYLAACRAHQVAERTRVQRLHRRAFQATGAAAAVFFGAFVISGWLYYRAEGARDVAEQQKELAQFTSHAMTQISGSASDEALRLANVAASAVKSSSVVDQVRAYLEFANHYVNAWNDNDALDALRRANQLIENLSKTREDPRLISLLRGYSHEIAGDIKWGDSPNAEGKYRDSLSALATADAPVLDQVRVERKLARTEMYQGRIEDAEAELRQAEAQLSQTPRALEQAFIDDHQADLLLMRGDTQEAARKIVASIDLFKESLKSNPRNVKAMIGLASELQKYGDLERHLGRTDAFELYQAAIELFSEASQINPTSFAALAGVDLARHGIKLLNKRSDADEIDDRKTAALSAAIDKAYAAGIGRFHFGMTIEEVNQLLLPPFNPDSLNNLPKATEYHSAEVRYFWRYIRDLPDFSAFVNNERCLDPSYAVFLFHDGALFRIVVRLESGRSDCFPLQRAVDDLAARYGLKVSGSESERRIRYQTRNLAITATTKPRDVSLDFIER